MSLDFKNLFVQGWRLAVAACAFLLAVAPAGATPITAGQSITAVGENQPVGGTLVGGTGTALGFTSATFSGTLTSSVITGDTSNPYGGLTFTYLLSNDSISPDAIERITVNSFAGFQTDVSFLSPGPGVQPTVSDRSASGNTMGFSFVGPPLSVLGTVSPGQSGALLVVQTDATYYAMTTAQVIDGSVATVASYGPVMLIPEPSTLVLAGCGLLAICGAASRSRRRRGALACQA